MALKENGNVYKGAITVWLHWFLWQGNACKVAFQFCYLQLPAFRLWLFGFAEIVSRFNLLWFIDWLNSCRCGFNCGNKIILGSFIIFMFFMFRLNGFTGGFLPKFPNLFPVQPC
jgi:hypothetical protein